MAFAIYLNREQFTPELPQIHDQHITQDTQFTYVDFIPGAVKRTNSAVMQKATIEYHTFREMIHTANSWLDAHRYWKLINCETIVLIFKFDYVNNCYQLKPNDSSFYIYGTEKNNILKALRIWLKRLNMPLRSPIIIDYMDIIPEHSSCKHETLDSMIHRINKNYSLNGLNGEIITIQTLHCESQMDWDISPERTLTEIMSKIVLILRIFYIIGDITKPQIVLKTGQDVYATSWLHLEIALKKKILTHFLFGIEDFVPKHISGGGFFKHPKFESFQIVLNRATKWLSQNDKIIFKNAQSLDIKLKSLRSGLGTKCMNYTEHGDYLKIFRIAYIKSNDHNIHPLILSSKMFMSNRRNEPLADIRQRIEDWVVQLGKEYDWISSESIEPFILSAESMQLFSKCGDILVKNLDNTFQYNRFGTKNGYIFMAFRIYLDIGKHGCQLLDQISDEPIYEESKCLLI